MASGKSRDVIYILIIAMLIAVVGYSLRDKKNQSGGALINQAVESPSESVSASTGEIIPPAQTGNSEKKTFVFDNFHGADLDGGVFKFEYPASWHNDGHYFSPIRIKYYDMASVDAPVYFDLISKTLFETSDVQYQIANDKRRVPDATVKIDGKTFRKYDLIDYGSSGGESTGRVIIYLGPQISFGGEDYYLVFRWEENPLTTYIPGNAPDIFEKMVLSLRFL